MKGIINKIIVSGDRYNYEIVSEGSGIEVDFYIRAICKATRRTSCINNLNTVMSELGIEGEEASPKYEDSTWVVTKKKADYFVKTAKKIFSRKSFVTYLERKLDEDRECGEWENTITKNGE